MAKVIQATDSRLIWTSMDLREVLRVAGQGALVGVVTYALYLLLSKYVFVPILCGDNAGLGRCENVAGFSGSMAIILGSLLGLTLLIRERVYRPLLALLGIVVALWGVFVFIAGLPWLIAMLVIVATFALSYALFSWLVQPVSLLAGAVSVTVVAVLIRLVLTV